MKIKATIATSVKSLRRNPMRALLTTLGIVIGISSVITMMEIGRGSSEAIKKSIASMGADSIMIFSGTQSFGGVSTGTGSVKTLTAEDCDAIARDCPSVKCASPLVNARGQVVYKNKNWMPSQIDGASPAYLDIHQWLLKDGDAFTSSDVLSSNKVCLIGKTVADNLFEHESPVGKEIRIMNIPFTVIGVLKAKGANMMGMDQDDIIVAPWTTLKYKVSGEGTSVSNQSSSAVSTSNTTSSLYPSGGTTFYPDRSSTQTANYMMYVRFSNIKTILLSARSSKEVNSAVEEIRHLLRQRHHLTDNKDDDFQIRSLNELSDTLSSTTKMFSNLLLSIAMISLIVGGVGIMNIMLVSVSERTREIGLRMAVGARQRDVLRQFLAESVMLCFVGGVIGIVIGHGASIVVNKILLWPVASSLSAIILAVLVSVSIGIIFGYYPAWKGSRLDPIEALRYE